MARVRFPVDALFINPAALAQLGERQTEDLKVPGSIPGGGTHFGFGPHCVALGAKGHSIDTARAVFGYRPDSDPFDAALVRLSIGSKACAGPWRIRRHRFSNPAPNPESWILPILCGLALPDGSSLQEGRDWTRGSHAATNPPSRHRQHAASAHPIRSHRPEIGLIGSKTRLDYLWRAFRRTPLHGGISRLEAVTRKISPIYLGSSPPNPLSIK